ncbi:MAG: hypothetical protein GF390_02985 [Candidatus Pacebacteria bacterium]|nr:hypothetical protein [Candidatus Paceibacterota bacterium]
MIQDNPARSSRPVTGQDYARLLRERRKAKNQPPQSVNFAQQAPSLKQTQANTQTNTDRQTDLNHSTVNQAKPRQSYQSQLTNTTRQVKATAEQDSPPNHATAPSLANKQPTNQQATPLPPKPPKRQKSRIVPGMYKPEAERTVLEWRAPSRPFQKKNRQYFTTVAVIGLLISLILFFAGQFLPIAVVVSVVFLVYVLAVIPPNQVTNKITTYGIRVEDNLYYWDELGRFWFEDKAKQRLLQIETIRFPGRITLLLNNITEEQLTEILTEVLLQEKPEQTFYEKTADWLKEKIPLEGI